MPSSSASTRSTIWLTGLALDRQAGGRRIGNADAREEQAHVVVDLGDGADRRARVARGGLLLDRDGRRQAVDLVDVRLLHHLEELARIGRQALDIAALALGIDRVEGERGLAGAGQAGHDDQLSRGRSRSMFFRLCSRAPRMDRNLWSAMTGPPPRLVYVGMAGYAPAKPISRYFCRHVERQSRQVLV